MTEDVDNPEERAGAEEAPSADAAQAAGEKQPSETVVSAEEETAGGDEQDAPEPDIPAPDEPTEGEKAAAALTDDRDNPDLLVFEKTWGHRLLAGMGVVMIVLGLVLVVYFASRIPSVSVYADVADWLVTMGYVLYGVGIAAGAAIIPPAILAIYVAKRPQHANLAIAAAVVALVLVVAFICYAVATQAGSVLTILLYAAILAIAPVVYLVAAVKVALSYVPDEEGLASGEKKPRAGKSAEKTGKAKKSRLGAKKGAHSR